MTYDISAIIVFHREKALVPTSINSFLKCVDFARSTGLNVEAIAVIDKPDELTLSLLVSYSEFFHSICVVAFGDLGSSRNKGREMAKGAFLSFFDGDDLWGDRWLVKCHEAAVKSDINNIVYHPEIIYYFSDKDYLTQSRDENPIAGASYIFKHIDSREFGFDPRVIVFNNIWTANTFGRKEIYEKYPYKSVERELGFGIEDWTWNAATLASNVIHAVVEGTVHCIRQKSTGSLGTQNSQEGLLPSIQDYVEQLDRL
jgi:glycosyltransferase involved in cell wall biosynthesis